MHRSEEEYGKTDSDAPESTKKWESFCVSCRKIKFLAGVDKTWPWLKLVKWRGGGGICRGEPAYLFS